MGEPNQGVAVTGTWSTTYTRRAHSAAFDQSPRTIHTHLEKCVGWCECGWRSATVGSRTAALRMLVSHHCQAEDPADG
jgi:hypothetical protein